MIKSLKDIKRIVGKYPDAQSAYDHIKTLKDIPAEVAAEFSEKYRTSGATPLEAIATLYDEVREEKTRKLTKDQRRLVSQIAAGGGVMIVNGDRCEIYKMIDGSPLELGKVRRLMKRGALISNDDGLFSGHTPQTMSVAGWAKEQAGAVA